MSLRTHVALLTLGLLATTAPPVWAAADLDPSTTFTAADGARTTLDVGGAWDGTADASASTGDTLTITIDNNASGPAGSDTAYDLTLVVTLPVGFNYVTGSANGVVGLTATQVGQTLTFAVPADTDLPPSTSLALTYGVVTATTVTSGTYELTYTIGYGTTDGATDGSVIAYQNLGVTAGATVLTVDRPVQTLAVGATASWTVEVTNSGVGGLFDVVLEEALINPNPSGSLQITSIVQTLPVTPVATSDADTLTLAYLAPGEVLRATVQATVTGCDTIDNEVSTTDRTTTTAKSTTAHVVLDLTEPLIGYTPPTTTLLYDTTGSVSFDVDNLGLGDADDIVLQTNLELLGVTVTAVSGDWSYNSLDGNFTLTAGSGTLSNGASSTLAFDIAPTDVCVSLGGGTVVWSSSYDNACAQSYLTPIEISTLNAVSLVPSIALSIVPDDDRLEVGATSAYRIRFDATQLALIQTDPIVVTHTLPTDVTAVTISAPGTTSSGCSGVCAGGDTVTWTIDQSDIGGTLDLVIDFTAPADPCLGGTDLTYAASLTASSTELCSLNASVSTTTLLINNPDAGVTQNFNVAAGTFETGDPDDGDRTRNFQEGEFLTYTVTYTFGVGSAGVWTNTTLSDSFGGLAGQTYVAGTMQYEVDGGGFSGVNPADITAVPGALSIDLGFLTAQTGGTTVSGHTVTLTYQTTIPDSDLLGATSRTFTQLVTLDLDGGAGGCAGVGSTFTQGAFVTIARAAPTISVAMPSDVSVCEDFTVTLTVDNSTSEFPSNLLMTIDTSGNYLYPTGQTPTYGGAFTDGNITYVENGGSNPTFELTPTSTELTAAGTITFQMHRAAATGTTPTSLDVTLDYDDHQEADTAGRDFSTSGSATPILVREGVLDMIVTPQSYTVTGSQASWTIYVTNTGAGAAVDASLTATVAAGLTPDATDSDALNPGYPVVVASQDMTWDLGDMASGTTRTIEVVVDVTSAIACSFTPGSNSATATWGCDATPHQTLSENSPDLLFLESGVQAYHDTTQSRARLCDTGTVIITARNTGGTHVFDVEITEVLNPLTSGVDYVASSSEFSTNGGGSWNPAGDPSGDGSAGSPYTWDSTDIADLVDLSPLTEGAGVSEILLRFSVTADETANLGDPTILAGMSGDLACGGSVASPGTPFTLPVEKPDIRVTMNTRNLTNGGSFAASAFGGNGDTVEWQVAVQNSGDHDAQNVRFVVNLPNSTPTSTVIDGTGFSSTPYTDNSVITVTDIAAGTTETFTITEVLGSSCVDATATATVTWGCIDLGATTPSGLSTPTDNSDTASFVMVPDFTQASAITQSFTALENGLTQVRLTMTNNGGRAENLVLTDALPAGIEIDTSFTPTLTSTGNVTNVAVNTADATTPVFTFTGTLINNTNARVTFRVLPVTDFDTTVLPLTSPETVGSGDTAVPAGGTNTATLSFDSSCGDADSDVDTSTLNPATPDLDMIVSPSSQVVADGEAVTYLFTITNNGDASSIAGNIDFTLTAGAGWTSVNSSITTPGTGGSGESCSGSCSLTDFGTLAQGASAVVTVTAVANDNAGSLQLIGAVTGSLTGGNYSLDQTQVRVVGFETTLTRQSTSETFSTGAEVAVGEEITWRLTGRYFGGEALTAVSIRNTLPTELGYVSHATVGSHDVTISGVTGDTAVTSGTINFSVSDFAGVGTFEVDLIARVLNVAGSTDGASLTNNVGYTFDAFGDTYASDAAADAFAGAESDLHADDSVTVRRPNISVAKLVRNVTTSGSFATSAAGEAGDTFEYQVTVNNSGNFPGLDVSIVDTLATSELLMVDGASDGIDNDGDGSIDDATEGRYTVGSGGDVTFDHTSTVLASGSPSQTLAQLDAGESLVFLYRVTAGSGVNPEEVLANNVVSTTTSLPGASGSQSSSAGVSGATDGELSLTDSDSIDVTVDSVALAKTIVATALGADTSTDVVIGEQITFELSVVLPSGTVPALEIDDSLPAGLSLVATPAVTLGSAIPGGQPTITPGALPASGSPLAINWDFGSRIVAAGTTAERTVTVTYTAQIENVVGNVEGTVLTNTASYSYTGSPANSMTTTVTVREPSIAVTQTVSPDASFDAGATLTYTVQVVNSGNATAYDLNMVETLAASLSYVASTTNITSGPSFGEPDTGGGAITWGRTQGVPQDIDLPAGQTLTFTYDVLVEDSVEPSQAMGSDFDLDWTSIDGDPGVDLGVTLGTAGDADGERNGGAGAVNDFAASDTDTATSAATATISVAESGDTLVPSDFRIGDLVTFTIQTTVSEGTFDSFEIEDTLPAGLAFFDAQSITPASGGAAFTYTQPTGGSLPSAGDTGVLTWSLGTVVNAGDDDGTNNTLTLVYRARILDTGGLATTRTTQTVSNSSVVRYLDAADGAQATAASTSDVTVDQPALTAVLVLAPGQTAPVSGGDTVDYVLTVTNGGDAPAYNTSLIDVLPADLRGSAVTTVSATVDGSSIGLGNPTWVGATGTATWTLSDSQTIPAGEALILTYRATLVSSPAAGATLANSTSVGAYHSKESSDATERRQYASVGPLSTSIVVDTPSDVSLSATTTASIGETVTYTITVPATAVQLTLEDATVTDTVPSTLRVLTVTSNATSLGTTLTDNTAGNVVDVEFDALTAGQQGVVTITAVVENQAGTGSGDTISNAAVFTYAMTDGGVQQVGATSNTEATTVTEPLITIATAYQSSTMSDPLQGLQAGDTVTYTVTIQNTGTGDAHDITIRDVTDDELISPLIAANPDNPGASTGSSSGGGLTTTSYQVAGPIAAGASFVFDVTLTLAGSVIPFQILPNRSEADWTSTAGANPDERDASGTHNDYTATSNTVEVTSGPAEVLIAEGAGGDGTYAPGETATYRIRFEYGQGTVEDLRLRHLLPVGLEYVSNTFTVTNTEALGGGTVALTAEPSPGDIGTLTFQFGDIASTAASPSIDLDVVVRVLDVPGNVSGTTLMQEAEAQIEFPSGSFTLVTLVPILEPTLTIAEPSVTLGLDGASSVGILSPTIVTARMINGGTSAAYQPVFVAQLDAGMRDTDPTTLASGALISGGRSLTLAEGADYTLAYSAGTGQLTLTLASAQAYIDPGETLTFLFECQLDQDATDGAAVDVAATVTTYASVDTSAATPPETRAYPTTLGAGTTGTANGATGDDATDDLPLTAERPIIVVTKSVDSAAASPGDALHYQVTITNTGSVATAASSLVQELDSEFAASTLSSVIVSPSSGTATVDPTGGANSTGSLTISSLVIGSGATVTIDYDATLEPSLPDASVVSAQSTLTVPGYTNAFLSDSTSAGDDDLAETGNDPADPSDDDPTRTIIGSMPIVDVTKAVADDNGSPLEAEDVITYTIVVSNAGNEDAINCVLEDAVPANTSYIANSTQLNGAPVSDVAGTTPLVSGMTINTPSEAAGRVAIGEQVTITFQVTVTADAIAGMLIENQATMIGSGEGSGALSPIQSDDPSTSAIDDATISVVGIGSLLTVTKVVTDMDGAPANAGDTLTYTITIANAGTDPATSVVIVDPIPNSTTYTPASITYDADGSGTGAAVAVSDGADADLGDFGATSAGAVTWTVGDLAAGAEVVVAFQVSIDGGTPGSTVVSNQAVVSSSELPDEPSDADGDDTNGDQATSIVVGNNPALRVTQHVVDLNGATVQPGDVLKYVFEIENFGGVDATNVTLTDALPPGSTTYVAGSTTVDSTAQPDTGVDSPLVAGLNLGTISSGESITVAARVAVVAGLAAASVITNQASYTADGGLSGLSDSDLDDGTETGNDGTDPNDDDPSQVMVGGSPGSASLSGIVWSDLNHNRLQDPEEPVQAGWIVELLQASTIVATTTTGSIGCYSISGLAPGSGYGLRFRHPTTSVTYGGPTSSAPGADTSGGMISGLSLSSGSTTLDQSLPLDPSGVVYDAITRDPIPGVLAVLTGPPGFDPNTQLLPGQHNQVTGADGRYRFDLVAGFPAGVYTINLVQTGGYMAAPSSTIAAQTGPLDPTGFPAPFEVAPTFGAPQVGQDTTYYFDFALAAGDPDVVNNHIPLDPIISDAMVIQLSTPMSQVSRGDLVPYTITATNRLSGALANIEIRSQLPPGFKFRGGSGQFNGNAIAPTEEGRTIKWSGLSFAANQSITIELVAIVGSATGFGAAVNQAWARNTLIDLVMSNTATAAVRVVPDPTFDVSEIVGKVFDDQNGNGIQDGDERGVPNVRLVTARGWIITTDSYGLYHIANSAVPNELFGSNFIVKLDPRSLPAGATMTTENPNVIRLTRGKLSRANFGVKLPQEPPVTAVVAGSALRGRDASHGELPSRAVTSRPATKGSAVAKSAARSDDSSTTPNSSTAPDTVARAGVVAPDATDISQPAIPSEWFAVGIADLTIGRNDTRGPGDAVTGDEQHLGDHFFADGRLAFYIKGKVGRYTVTASADTQGQPLRNLFSNFNDKDAFSLFRRIDSKTHQPTYGDESTLVEDAPTQGKFYFRLEDERSRVEWGSFRTRILETDFAQIDRSLYGGHLDWRSEAATVFGESRTRLDVFAAEAGTIPAREEFRGTGGSLYYLSHRDVTQGSEQVRVETRDRDSGLVLQTKPLSPGRDYSFDAIQGRLVLSNPLASTDDDEQVVRTGTLSGHPQFLVVRYEYTPLLTELKDVTLGGRASHWVTDYLQVGATSTRQDLAGFDYHLYAGDITLRKSAGTYLKAEIAQTKGVGLGAQSSVDGGFRFATVAQDRADPHRVAYGYRIEGATDLADFESLDLEGQIAVYLQHRDRGFSAPGQLTDTRTHEWGGRFRFTIDERTHTIAKYDERFEGSGVSSRASSLDIERVLDRNFTWTVGGRTDWRRTDNNPTTAANFRDGSRTDVATQLAFNSHSTWDAYGFGQATVSRSARRRPANRGGVGSSYRVDEQWKLNGEISGGNGGVGLQVGTEHQHDANSHSYLSYRIGADGTDFGSRGQGATITLGSRQRFEDSTSVFSEQRATSEGRNASLTQAIGIDFVPIDLWQVSFSAEDGIVVDRSIGELERTAFTVSSSFDGSEWKVANSLEGRFEEDDSVERTTWLLRNNASLKFTPSVTGIAQLNWSVSHTDNTDFIDGDYTELVIGAAHRPIENNRWSTLIKYTYFANLPPSAQVSNQGVASTFQQQSHIFSIDTNYDLCAHLTIGAKYGLRLGRLRAGRSEGRWHSSTAQLGILRTDFHVIDKWDALAEFRWLEVREAQDHRYGVLLGVYRHVNPSLRIGVGYDFSQFSDDLTDLDYRTQGWFLNLIGTF